MALIKCTECGKEISDKAKVCINCGCPVEYSIEIKEEVIDEVEYDESENIRIEYNNGSFIEIKNGYMTIYNPILGIVTDVIENFVLDYYDIIMGMTIGFSIYNINNTYFTGVVDVNIKKDIREKFDKLKEILFKHNCFLDRKRFDALYKLPKEVKIIHEEFLSIKRKEYFQDKNNACPRCGSKRFHAFVEEKEIISGKTKTRYTANLNPLKPFTFANKKEKVVRNPVTMQISKFVCDDCGKIFQ